jgi:hypothetical protein
MAGNTPGPAPIYTDADYHAVCDLIAKGIPASTVCSEPGRPSVTALWRWTEANEANAEKYAHARKAGCLVIATEALLIADTPLEGAEEKLQLLGVMKRPGDDSGPPVVLPDAELVVTEVKRTDNVARSKLMVDTRFRLLRSWDPETYGDKVAVDNKHSGAVGFAININDQPKPKAGA